MTIHTSPLADHRRLFEDSLVAIHEIDTGGVIRDVNQAECRLLGYARQELIGHHVAEFVASELGQMSREAIARKISREQPVSTATREYRRNDGSYIWLEIHEHLIENDAGDVTGIRSALFDITERYHGDAKMRKERDWMRRVLHSLAAALVTTDVFGHVDFMNRAAEELTGWVQQDALGRPLEEISRLQHDPGEPVDLMSCILYESARSNPQRKFAIVDRSGASRAVTWVISPICNDNGTIIGAALVMEKRQECTEKSP
jgi:PAS domain S-box-containing protein